MALAILWSATVAAQAQVGDDDTTAIDDQPHITMLGSASFEVVPDIAEISLGVTTERAGASEASEANAKVAQAIVATAKAQGIDPKDIQTQSVTLSQVFDDIHDASGRYTGRKPRGFSASDTIRIRVRALDHAGALAQSLIEKGANRFDGISFSIEHPQPIMDRLLAEAVRDAKRQATIAATALGSSLGPVLLIERPQAARGEPLYASRMKAMPMAAPPPIPVEAGTQTLQTDITVTWALRP